MKRSYFEGRSLWVATSLVLLLGSAGCGDDPGGPAEEGSLDAGDHVDSSVPGHDAGKQDTMADAEVEQKSDAGATGTDAGSDSGSPSTRPVDALTTTTTPNAKFVYVGAQTAPFEIVASNLSMKNSAGDLSVDWLVRLKSKLADTLCASTLTFTFKDKTGTKLFTMNPTLDMRPYVQGSGGVTDCVNPGELINGDAIYFAAGEGDVTLEDVATIEWKFQLVGYLDTLVPAKDVTISKLSATKGALGRPALAGHVINNSLFGLQVFSVHVWVLNAGGMPLDYFIASYNATLTPNAAWDFTTSTSSVDFDVNDVEVLPSYVR